jgi:hypothetical protein
MKVALKPCGIFARHVETPDVVERYLRELEGEPPAV